MAGVRAAIDVHGLAGHKGRRLEVENRLDNFLNLAHSPQRVQRGKRGVRLGACMGVLMMPGATALTRIPLSAYSIARERVTASSPPLVSDASADGTPLTGWPTSVVVRFTMCPPPLCEHLPNGPLSDVEEPGKVDPRDVAEVGLGVLCERLGDEHAGVIDQRVDPAKPLDRVADDPVGDRRVGDVAGNSQHVRRSIGLDGPRVGDNPVAAIEKALDQSCTDPLRGASNHDNFTFGAHEHSLGTQFEIALRQQNRHPVRLD